MRKLSLQRALRMIEACPEGRKRAGNRPARVAWARATDIADLIFLCSEFNVDFDVGALKDIYQKFPGISYDDPRLPPLPGCGQPNYWQVLAARNREFDKLMVPILKARAREFVKLVKWRDFKKAALEDTRSYNKNKRAILRRVK